DSNNNAATLTLASPGSTGSLSANKSFVIFTPDTVTNVTSTTANGTYGTGATITITVDFSRAVTVTGTPHLALNSGGTASYSSGTGTSTLTFTYLVNSGDSSPRLDYSATGSLSGTIKDANNNAATLTLAAPGAAAFSGLGTDTLTWTISPVSLGVFGNSLLGTAADAIKDAVGNAITTFNENLRVLWGDVNDDGVVSSADVVAILIASRGTYNIFADLNGDGKVDTVDAQIARLL